MKRENKESSALRRQNNPRIDRRNSLKRHEIIFHSEFVVISINIITIE